MPVTRDAVAMEREPYPSCLVYGSMKKLLSGLETEKNCLTASYMMQLTNSTPFDTLTWKPFRS